MYKILAFIFLILASGCFITAMTNEQAVTPHATPIVKDSNLCYNAEQNLQKLGCISKDKPFTSKGLSFTQFCQKKQDQGIFLNPACLATITSCNQMDCCTQTKVCTTK